MNKILVLLSGGIDSSTALALAVQKEGRKNVFALNIHYGQKHDIELKAARKVAEYYRVDYHVMELPAIFANSNSPLLKHSDKEIKHQSYAEQLKELGGTETVDTYVPFRNGIMISVAASYALSVGASVIYYGAHADDAAGRAYPDCTVHFSEAMASAVVEGTGGRVTLQYPFINLTKDKIVAIGLELLVPYELTWSCYEGKAKPCGVCGTCIDREKAFKLNQVYDPYKTLWEKLLK